MPRRAIRASKIALELTRSTSKLLSSVQVGITLVGVLTGAFGGATLAERLTTLLIKVRWLAPYAPTLALIIVVLLTTYFSLVIGELIPKKLALNNPEHIASRVSGIMRFISRLDLTDRPSPLRVHGSRAYGSWGSSLPRSRPSPRRRSRS